MENVTHFSGQHHNEKIQFFFRHHWIILLGLILQGTITMLIVIAIISFLSFKDAIQYLGVTLDWTIFTLIIILGVLWQHLWLKIFAYIFDVVIVTDHRILDIERTVFFDLDAEVLDMVKIQDMGTHQHGVLPAFLHYGDLEIILAAANESVVMHYVPQVSNILHELNHCKRQAIANRQIRGANYSLNEDSFTIPRKDDSQPIAKKKTISIVQRIMDKEPVDIEGETREKIKKDLS